MESVLFVIVGNIAKLTMEGLQFCFSLVLLKFTSADNLGNTATWK